MSKETSTKSRVDLFSLKEEQVEFRGGKLSRIYKNAKINLALSDTFIKH